MDFYSDGSFGLSAGPFQVVHDFDTQVQYFINRHTSNCSTTPLREGEADDIVRDQTGTPHIISPSQLIYRGNDHNYTYEGVTTIRGVGVDSWITVFERMNFSYGAYMTNGVFEVFFTRPEYTVGTDRSPGGVAVPWRLNARGLLNTVNATNNVTMSKNVSYIIDFSDFSANEPPYDAFDVSVCFSGDETHTVLLIFNTSRVGIDFNTFRTNLRASIVAATKIKPLQVNNIHVSWVLACNL